MRAWPVGIDASRALSGTTLLLPPKGLAVLMLQESTMRPSRLPAMWGARRGPEARAAALRADAKLALQRLAAFAHRESRHSATELGELSGHVEAASKRLHEYCHFVASQLELSHGVFGLITASYFRYFEQRQRLELEQLAALATRAPRSAGVAHGAYVTAAMLIGELDAQGRDVAAAIKRSAAVEA
jgi:hypothetical protein